MHDMHQYACYLTVSRDGGQVEVPFYAAFTVRKPKIGVAGWTSDIIQAAAVRIA